MILSRPFIGPMRFKGRGVVLGVIDPRLDLDFIQALSDRMTKGTIVFIGPQQNPDSRIAALRNVTLMPAVGPDELPAIAAKSACLIMPYRDSEVTRAMQPLKLKEYLATGLPVVARQLPATQAWSDACDLVSTAEDFAAMVERRIEQREISQEQKVARTRLSDEGWKAKADQFYEWVQGGIGL